MGSYDSNTLVLGGFKFSKLHNRKKGILVTSVDPKDPIRQVVVSCKEGSGLNGSNPNSDDIQRRITKRCDRGEGGEEKEKKLERNALLFCRLVNKMLRKQNSSCFVGYEVIYKMVASGLAKTRAEALAIGKDLSKKKRLFYRVEVKRNTFSDDGKLYKFRPEVLLSVIMKSPMRIQKVAPSDQDEKPQKGQSKPTATGDVSFSPTKFRKFVPKKDLPNSKNEVKIPRNKFGGKPRKKGRRPKGRDSAEAIDQMHMLCPEDHSPVSEADWIRSRPKKALANYGNHAVMEPIRENRESSGADNDDQSIYTEVTVTEHKKVPTFPRIPGKAQHIDDDSSYMELTVSTTGGGDSRRETHSYFDEYTLSDDDEYDIMSVPTTPVVRQKLNGVLKPNVPTNKLFSPTAVTSFDKSAPRSGKSIEDSSFSNRMRRGELDIEIPNLDDDIDDDI